MDIKETGRLTGFELFCWFGFKVYVEGNMDILLTGGTSYFMDAMIDKFTKEGHRVYVLSGNKYGTDRYKKVFEQYDFSYDAVVINEVIESIAPDTVIFSGAYDSNYSKESDQGQIVSYTTGLVNLLMALQCSKKKVKFIYLSSEQIFQERYEEPLTERDIPKSYGAYQLAIRQGEQSVLNAQTDENLETYVLRLDHLYGQPKTSQDFSELLSEMCREGMFFNNINTNEKNRYTLLSVGDAIQHIYTFVNAKEPKQRIYHISSGNTLTETEIAVAVAEGMANGNKKISVTERSLGMDYHTCLSAEAFNQEFGAVYRDHPEDSIRKIANYVRKHFKKYYQTNEKKFVFTNRILNQLFMIFQILIPYIENTVCFIPFFMLNNRAVGSQYFANLDFYLIYVLLFAIIFGQQQATYSAILATAGYIFRQQYTRSSFEVILDYNTYVWIAQLFILGLVVGYLKDRLRAIRGEDKREIEYLKNQMDDISTINSSNVQIKNVLESQIINQNDSFGRVYEITSSLDQYATEEVLFYAVEVVSKLIHSKDVAIYSISNGDYARLFAATSDKARCLGNSIRYKELPEMYRELERDRVYINKDMNDAYPLMADAIFSQEKMEMIIMAWGIPWDRMTLSQANMLRVTGFLIQNAILRADRYMEALEAKRYHEGTSILEREAFKTLLGAYVQAANRGLTEVTVLSIALNGRTILQAGMDLGHALRTSDYMGQLDDGQLYVLLSNTNLENANFVMDRFKKLGYIANVQNLEEIQL